MDNLMIVLRVIHIFAGVFWVGTAFFNIGFLQPAVRASGPEGQKTMQYLMGRTRLLTTTYLVATLNILSGLWMYGILSQFQLSFFRSSYGLALAIGGLSGIVAWVLVIFVMRSLFSQMQTIGREIQAQGGPPTAEQGAIMQKLGARLGTVGRINVVWLTITLLAMASAQYL